MSGEGVAAMNFKEVFDMTKIADSFVKAFVSQTPKIIVIVVMSWLAIRMVKLLAMRMEKTIGKETDPLKFEAKSKRARTLSITINGAMKAFVLVVAGSMIIESVGIKIGPILASVGFIGLAFGFGAQSLVKDIVTGFFLLVENQFGVGDVITVAGVSGQVEDINLRVTRLRDSKGIVHHIPNGQITVVSNMTKDWSRALLDIPVNLETDIERATGAIRAVCDQMKADTAFAPLLLEDFEVLGIETLDQNAATLRVMVKTMPLRQWEVARELRQRIKETFDKEGIAMAVRPQQVIVKTQG